MGLIKRGRLNIEDEVGLGQIWEEKFGIKALRYVPLFISIIVSMYTLNLTLELLSQKAEWLFDIDYLFTVITIIAFLVTMKPLEWLDEKIRINWGVIK